MKLFNSLWPLLVIILFFPLNSYSKSDTQIDSLLQQLNHASGTDKIVLLNKLSLLYLNSNPELSGDYAGKMLKMATIEGNDSMLSKAYYDLGLSYYFREYWAMAAEYFTKAINSSWGNNSEIFKARCANNAGICFEFLGDYDKAVTYYYQTITVSEKLRDTLLTARSRLNLGMLYLRMHDEEKAKKMFLSTLPVFKQFNDVDNIINAFQNLFIAEGELGNFNRAELYYNKALSLAKQKNDSLQISAVQSDYGNLLQECRDNYSGARNCYNQALFYVDSVNNTATYFLIVSAIGQNELYLGNIQKAEKLLKDAYNNLKKLEVKSWLSSVEFNLSRLYARKGNFILSDKYLDAALEHKRELFEEKKINSISEMEVKYQTEKKEQELLIQNLQIASQKKQLFFISIIASLFALALSIVLFMIKKVKVTNRNLFERNKDLTSRWEKLKSCKIDANDKDNDLFNQISGLMNREMLYKNPKLTVDSVSKQINSNSKYVSQAIKEKTGMNFNSYVNTYRIEEAKKILLDTETKSWSLDAVALNCGFNNPTTFYLSFKKYTGLTPASYRSIS